MNYKTQNSKPIAIKPSTAKPVSPLESQPCLSQRPDSKMNLSFCNSAQKDIPSIPYIDANRLVREFNLSQPLLFPKKPTPWDILKPLQEEIKIEQQCSQDLQSISLIKNIGLPSLVPMVSVGGENQSKLDASLNNNLREAQLMRRRLNSEDEKSLISFNKLEFGGFPQEKSISKVNGDFLCRVPRGLGESASRALYDKTINDGERRDRKKSMDLGSRVVVNCHLEVRNKSQDVENRLQLNLTGKPRQMLGQVDKHCDLNKMQSKKKGVRKFNQPNCVRRTDIEQLCCIEVEGEVTKGSSFNTETAGKSQQIMVDVLGHSQDLSTTRKHMEDIRSGSEGICWPKSKQNDLLIDTRIFINRNEFKESNIKRTSGRKSSVQEINIRKNSLTIDVSLNEERHETAMVDSVLEPCNWGFAYKNIGSHMSNVSSENECRDYCVSDFQSNLDRSTDKPINEMEVDFIFIGNEVSSFKQRARKVSGFLETKEQLPAFDLSGEQSNILSFQRLTTLFIFSYKIFRHFY